MEFCIFGSVGKLRSKIELVKHYLYARSMREVNVEIRKKDETNYVLMSEYFPMFWDQQIITIQEFLNGKTRKGGSLIWIRIQQNGR